MKLADRVRAYFSKWTTQHTIGLAIGLCVIAAVLVLALT